MFETTGPGTGTDTCYNASGGMYPGPAFTTVTGSVWNVGYAAPFQKNTWGWDTVGWPSAGVAWYRANIAGSLPCTATIPQRMNVVVNGESTGNIIYNSGTIVAKIDASSLEVSRNGVNQIQ